MPRIPHSAMRFIVMSDDLIRFFSTHNTTWEDSDDSQTAKGALIDKIEVIIDETDDASIALTGRGQGGLGGSFFLLQRPHNERQPEEASNQQHHGKDQNRFL